MTTKSASISTSGGRKHNAPLVVIVGETASGKSQLALRIAKKINGEIISADSRMIYKGMDIGTAKPSKQDQAEVKHHMIDLINPDKIFTVADYKQKALESISSVREKKKVPIMVGGTGLYIDAVVFDYSFRAKYDNKIREKLETMSNQELLDVAVKSGFSNEVLKSNRRQIIRTLEAGANNHNDRTALIDNVHIIGLKISRSELRKRIISRVEQMFVYGLRKEVDELVTKYGWGHESLTGIGYREFEDYYARKVSISEVKRTIVQHTLNYAKRQRTWFKRNPAIDWFGNQQDAFLFVVKQIAEEQV